MKRVNSPSAEKLLARDADNVSDGNESATPIVSAPHKLIKGKELAQNVGGKHIARQSDKAKAVLLKGQHLDLQTKLFSSRFEGIYFI